VAGARGRRRKERGAGALTCGAQQPEREGALGLALRAGLGACWAAGEKGEGSGRLAAGERGKPKREEG
jgi:hypothetical protein